MYHWVATEISVQDGLLMRGSRIVISASLRLEMLDRIHTGHLGITKCRERAKQSVWWHGLSRPLEELAKNCSECRKTTVQKSEPLIPSTLPKLPWQRVATDLFELKGRVYLLIDYFSRYIEVARLDRTTAGDVILHTKADFARHGIPEMVVSDNGPQFSSEAYASFARQYGFEHVTSSPRYPQSNGESERAVQTVKNLVKKDGDAYLAMLSYRSTPLRCGFSPAELLMAWKLRTTVPMTRASLKPAVPARRESEERYKRQQQSNYDHHHGVRPLAPLAQGRECGFQTAVRRPTWYKRLELGRTRYRLLRVSTDETVELSSISPARTERNRAIRTLPIRRYCLNRSQARIFIQPISRILRYTGAVV